MKKLMILLLLSSCTIFKQNSHLKNECVNKSGDINFVYDSTVWKVVPMTREDSLLLIKN